MENENNYKSRVFKNNEIKIEFSMQENAKSKELTSARNR